MCYFYTMVCYSAVKNNYTIIFEGKHLELEKTILSDVMQTQINFIVYSVL